MLFPLNSRIFFPKLKNRGNPFAGKIKKNQWKKKACFSLKVFKLKFFPWVLGRGRSCSPKVEFFLEFLAWVFSLSFSFFGRRCYKKACVCSSKHFPTLISQMRAKFGCFRLSVAKKIWRKRRVLSFLIFTKIYIDT